MSAKPNCTPNDLHSLVGTIQSDQGSQWDNLGFKTQMNSLGMQENI